MADLVIDVDGRALAADWTDEAPATRDAVADALPLAGDGTRWGDELYFRTHLDLPPENARTVVPEGALAFWPQGNALCLFWGPTPESDGDEPRAAAPVNVVAIVDDLSPLHDLDGDARVEVRSAER